MSNIKVSFIIPAYNVAEYIGECLESVLSQNIEKEIIVVDDGSTDNTAEIVKKYAQKYNCIRIIHKENQGLSCARNDGAAIAQGEYLCFIDGDDYYLEDFAGWFYKLCKKFRLDIIRGWYARCYPDGRIKKVTHPASFLNRPMNAYDFLTASVYEHAIEVVAVTGFIRRDFYLKSGLKFEEGLFYEDQLFFLKMLLSSKNCTVMQVIKCIYGYRIRKGSITSSPNKKKFLDLIEIMRRQTYLVDSLRLEGRIKTAANRVISASMSHLISLYLRLSQDEQTAMRDKIPKGLMYRALRYALNLRDFLKIIIFIYSPGLLKKMFNAK